MTKNHIQDNGSVLERFLNGSLTALIKRYLVSGPLAKLLRHSLLKLRYIRFGATLANENVPETGVLTAKLMVMSLTLFNYGYRLK